MFDTYIIEKEIKRLKEHVTNLEKQIIVINKTLNEQTKVIEALTAIHPTDNYLSTPQAAAFLCISISTLNKHSHEIPHVMVGKRKNFYCIDDLREWRQKITTEYKPKGCK